MLPELLKWYYKDITSVVRPPSDQQDSRRFTDHETWTELLLRISPYLRGDQFKNFDDIAPQLTVTFQPHHWHFGYTFENSNVFSERYLLVNHKSARSSNAAQNGPKYTLTKGLSNYLMAQSPLVASLANLSCAQGSSKGRTDKHNASDADFPSLLSGGTNSGTHSLEIASPFEFAINRTAKFPFLQRHITSGFYSVLKFLYLGGLGLVQSVSQRCTSFGTDLSDRDQSRLFLLDESSPEVSDVFLRAVNYAWCKADWELLLEIFNSANLKEQGRLGDPEDFVLEMAFQSAAVTKQDDDISAQAASTLRTFNIPAPNFDLNWKQNPWLLLYRVKNNYLRASIVLQCLHNWADVTVCLDLLNFCCSKPPRDPELLAALQRKTKQLSLCQKVGYEWLIFIHMHLPDDS